MANRILKDKVLKDRIENQSSYSDLKKKFGVSKSTLSGWLKDYPLSKDRINALRANSEQRIERFRGTMVLKQKAKKDIAYQKAVSDLGSFSQRDILIAGLYLYWAEGGKTDNTSVCVTNTNPAVLRFFIKWLESFGVKRDQLRVSWHLYSDMDIEKQLQFWSKELKISKANFRKPHIKQSKLTDITYRNGFGQGTCTVSYGSKPLKDFVLMCLKRMSELF